MYFQVLIIISIHSMTLCHLFEPLFQYLLNLKQMKQTRNIYLTQIQAFENFHMHINTYKEDKC